MLSVCQQSEALARHGLTVSVMTVRAGAGAQDYRPRPDLVDTIVVRGVSLRKLRFTFPIGFSRTLRQHCRTARTDVIHNHGLWTPMNHLTAVVANQLQIPLVWTIHGMLSSWSLHHKRWKKSSAWWLYQRRDLERARVFVATARHEAEAIRAAGCKQPIAVIPDGIDIPTWESPHNAGTPRKVLFVGRIYPVKGLMNLVRAWAKVRRPGWECVIAGPDTSGYQAELQAEITALQVQNDFRFVGRVDGDAKWDLYRSADILVLPSFTENFGKVVPEALSCGIPVIATKAAPWECLVSNNCGWWIEVGVEPLARALSEAVGATDAERRAMGRRGRRLVEERFSCALVALEIKGVYEWVLRGGPPPGCVSLS
ncbi:MAG: glycosyltransferase [Verrucomicrobia bacterium]|jgi:glycosyltransferase involved in cell wall biosynthesis|nr:glycosyltransferase [Verrucomicrobiota bacterium]